MACSQDNHASGSLYRVKQSCTVIAHLDLKISDLSATRDAGIELLISERGDRHVLLKNAQEPRLAVVKAR